MPEQTVVAELQRKVLGHQHIVAAALAGLELEADRIRLVLRFLERRLQPVDRLLLARDRHVIALLIEALLLLDDPFDALDLALRVVVDALHREAVFLLEPQELRVVALVLGQVRVLDLEGAVRDRVEEIAVVRNHDVRAAVVLEKVLEPFHGGDVEVVRRLVEQQQVRFAEQHLRKLDLCLLAAAQHADRRHDLLGRKAEADERAARAVAAGQPALRDEAVVQLRLLQDQRVDIVRHGGDLRIQAFQLRLHPQKRLKYGHDLVERGLFHIAADVLLHIADRGFARGREAALVGRVLAVQDFEQRRLAGAVDADQADPVALLYLKRNTFQNHIGAKHLFYVVDR